MWKMNLDSVKEKVGEIIEPVISSLDIELVDIEMSMMRGQALLPGIM
jgi:ribosome maturation factor RimP